MGGWLPGVFVMWKDNAMPVQVRLVAGRDLLIVIDADRGPAAGLRVDPFQTLDCPRVRYATEPAAGR